MPKVDVLLRPYEPADLEDVVAMWRASKRHAFPYVEVQQRYTLEDDTGYFRDVLCVEASIWVAQLDGRIAGMTAMKADLIDQLFVRVDVQRHGVGTALLRKAMELSPSALRLYTFEKNTKARAFYEKHGFTVLRFGVSPPPENEPDVEYVWRPPPSGDEC